MLKSIVVQIDMEHENSDRVSRDGVCLEDVMAWQGMYEAKSETGME
jgi:hypothetical protein